MSEFARQHPPVTVELLTGSGLYSLAHREADIVSRIVPFDEPDILQRRVLGLRFGIYAAKGAAVRLGDDGAGQAIVADGPIGIAADS